MTADRRARPTTLTLVGHGETAWSAGGRHAGLTDLPLTAHGEEQARALGVRLARVSPTSVLTSPLQRARRTAELVGMSADGDPDLLEWNYGSYEGRTTARIRAERPGWWLWTDGAPGGESWEQVQFRCERALARIVPLLGRGDVALFGHDQALRALAAVWVGLPAYAGGLFSLDPASLSVLGEERGHRVIRCWNDAAGPRPAAGPH